MTTEAENGLTWIKADFHLHTSEDSCDAVDYSAIEVIERAHQLGFGALAITLHYRVFDEPAAFARARELGLLLIPAAELRIDGADVVALNLSAREAERIHTFDDLRALRAERGDSLLTFAPHPFYRIGGSVGSRIRHFLDCFDAIEHCHFHIPLWNPNAPAARLAEQTGKPLLATSDAHRRVFFGNHYSLLGLAEQTPTIEGVFAALRANRIQRVSPKGGLWRLGGLLFFLFCLHPILKRLSGRKDSRPKGSAVPSRTQPASIL